MATISILSVPNLTIPSRHPSSSVLPYHEKPGTSAAHLTAQWLDLYDRGKKIFPGLAGVSSLANLYALWKLRDSPSPAPAIFGSSWSTCYALVIASTMSLVPFTGLFMMETNRALKAHATRDDAASAEGLEGMVVSPQEKAKRDREDEEVLEVLWYWSKLNLVRALFPLVGAGIGFYAAVSSWIIP